MSSTVTLAGNPVAVAGNFPQKGDQAPAFSLVGKDLADVTLTTMRGREFLEAYGVAIADGPLVGVSARGVVVLNEQDQVIHSELVSEITVEPDYAAALAALA